MWIVPPATNMIEPFAVPDTHVESIGALELRDGIIRVYLVTEQLPIEAGAAAVQKIVQAKLIGHVANVPAIIGQLALCLCRSPFLNERELPPGTGGHRPYLVR